MSLSSETRIEELRATDIVCGHVLPALAGPRAVFDPDHPSPATGPLGGEQLARTPVMVDGGWAEARPMVNAAPPLP